MRTIKDYLPVIDRALEELGTKPFDLSFHEILQVMKLHHSRAADAACSFYAEGLTWPPLSEPLRFEVCLRLACARDYCNACTYELDQGEDWRSAVVSILNDYWKDAGRADWIDEVFLGREIDGLPD